MKIGMWRFDGDEILFDRIRSFRTSSFLADTVKLVLRGPPREGQNLAT